MTPRPLPETLACSLLALVLAWVWAPAIAQAPDAGTGDAVKLQSLPDAGNGPRAQPLETHIAEVKGEMLAQLSNSGSCFPRVRFVTGATVVPFGMNPKDKNAPQADAMGTLANIVSIGRGMAAQNQLQGSVIATCQASLKVDGRDVGPLVVIWVEAPGTEPLALHSAFRKSAEGGFEYFGAEIRRPGTPLVLKK